MIFEVGGVSIERLTPCTVGDVTRKKFSVLHSFSRTCCSLVLTTETSQSVTRCSIVVTHESSVV